MGQLCLCHGEPQGCVVTLGVGVCCSYKGGGRPQSRSGDPREEDDPVHRHRAGIKLLHGSVAQGDGEKVSPLHCHYGNGSVWALNGTFPLKASRQQIC